MKIANTRFDDPEHLGEPSRLFISSMIQFELLDYARRYFERKGDKSSMERVQLLLFSLSYGNEKVAKLNMSYLNSNCT